MARLGIDIAQAQAPEEVAQDGLDNIARGPVFIAGGEAAHETARRRSVVDGRAEAIRSFATPRREAILKT